jgi:hypothetical protein
LPLDPGGRWPAIRRQRGMPDVPDPQCSSRTSKWTEHGPMCGLREAAVQRSENRDRRAATNGGYRAKATQAVETGPHLRSRPCSVRTLWAGKCPAYGWTSPQHRRWRQTRSNRGRAVRRREPCGNVRSLQFGLRWEKCLTGYIRTDHASPHSIGHSVKRRPSSGGADRDRRSSN